MGCGTSKNPVVSEVSSPGRQEPKVNQMFEATHVDNQYNSWTLERNTEPVDDKKTATTEKTEVPDEKDPSKPNEDNTSFIERLLLLLRIEDPENIGFVPYHTLEKALLSTTQLSTPAFLRILAEAEQNGRGMVYYEAFSKRAAKVHERISNNETSGGVIRQLDETTVVHILQKNIKDATSDWLTPPTNTLTRYNLRRLLETCDLGLTTKEINVILCKVTEDPPGSGTINTDEAIVQTSTTVLNLEPYILLENVRTVEEWKEFLRPQFIKRDKGPSGFLENYSIREILSASDLGLTPLQVVQLLTYTTIDDSGKIKYEDCLELLGQKLSAIFSETKALERAGKLPPKTEKYRDFTAESFAQVLGDALSNVSPTGEISRANLVATVSSVINPTPQELNSIKVITPFEVVEYKHMIPAIWEAFVFLNNTKDL